MARFGETQVHDTRIQGNKLAKTFIKVFGTVDTSSSHLHFTRIVRKIDFDHVLDAGCGRGKFSFWLAQEYPRAKIDACDLSQAKIDHCNTVQDHLETQNTNFFVQDLVAFENEGYYDFIFTNHVLEHIVENRTVISALVSSLKKGGHIYIQIPNAIQKRLPFAERFVEAHDEWAQGEHIGQPLTLDLLCSELEHLGCRILIARHTEGFWGELRFELAEMALRHYQSYALYSLFFPLLKVLGGIDSLIDYSQGNGILVLAKKGTTDKNVRVAPTKSG